MVGDVATATIFVVVELAIDPMVHLRIGAPCRVVQGDDGTHATLQNVGRKFVGEAMEEFTAVACCLSSQSEGAREGLLVIEEIVIVGIERLQSLDDGTAVIADACVIMVIAFGVETDFHIILSYQSPRQTRPDRTSD